MASNTPTNTPLPITYTTTCTQISEIGEGKCYVNINGYNQAYACDSPYAQSGPPDKKFTVLTPILTSTVPLTYSFLISYSTEQQAEKEIGVYRDVPSIDFTERLEYLKNMTATTGSYSVVAYTIINGTMGGAGWFSATLPGTTTVKFDGLRYVVSGKFTSSITSTGNITRMLTGNDIEEAACYEMPGWRPYTTNYDKTMQKTYCGNNPAFTKGGKTYARYTTVEWFTDKPENIFEFDQLATHIGFSTLSSDPDGYHQEVPKWLFVKFKEPFTASNGAAIQVQVPYSYGNYSVYKNIRGGFKFLTAPVTYPLPESYDSPDEWGKTYPLAKNMISSTLKMAADCPEKEYSFTLSGEALPPDRTTEITQQGFCMEGIVGDPKHSLFSFPIYGIAIMEGLNDDSIAVDAIRLWNFGANPTAPTLKVDAYRWLKCTHESGCVWPVNGEFVDSADWFWLRGATWLESQDAFLPYNGLDSAESLVSSSTVATLPTLSGEISGTGSTTQTQWLILRFDGKTEGVAGTALVKNQVVGSKGAISGSWTISSPTYLRFEQDISQLAGGTGENVGYLDSTTEATSTNGAIIDNVCAFLSDRPPQTAPYNPNQNSTNITNTTNTNLLNPNLDCNTIPALLSYYNIDVRPWRAVYATNSYDHPDWWWSAGYVRIAEPIMCLMMELFNVFISMYNYAILDFENYGNFIVQTSFGFVQYLGGWPGFFNSLINSLYDGLTGSAMAYITAYSGLPAYYANYYTNISWQLANNYLDALNRSTFTMGQITIGQGAPPPPAQQQGWLDWLFSGVSSGVNWVDFLWSKVWAAFQWLFNMMWWVIVITINYLIFGAVGVINGLIGVINGLIQLFLLSLDFLISVPISIFSGILDIIVWLGGFIWYILIVLTNILLGIYSMLWEVVISVINFYISVAIWLWEDFIWPILLFIFDLLDLFKILYYALALAWAIVSELTVWLWDTFFSLFTLPLHFFSAIIAALSMPAPDVGLSCPPNAATFGCGVIFTLSVIEQALGTPIFFFSLVCIAMGTVVVFRNTMDDWLDFK